MQRDHSHHHHHHQQQQQQQQQHATMANERQPSHHHKKRYLMPRSRSKSFHGLAVNLSLLSLQTLLGRIAPLCTRLEQRAMCDHFRSTLTHSSLDCPQTMEELKFFLKDQLASHKIPSNVVADIHSCVGLIQAKLGNPRSAIVSLMNALWIQQKINNLEDANVVKALTEHRLATLYAQAKEYDSAVSLIEKAYSAYQQSKMKPDHEVYKECVQCVQSYRLKLLELKMVERGTLHSTLSVVDEGSTLSLLDDASTSTSNSSPKQFAALGA